MSKKLKHQFQIIPIRAARSSSWPSTITACYINRGEAEEQEEAPEEEGSKAEEGADSYKTEGERDSEGGNSLGVHHNYTSSCCGNTVTIGTTQYYHGHVCTYSLTHTEISMLRVRVSCHGSEGSGGGWGRTGTSLSPVFSLISLQSHRRYFMMCTIISKHAGKAARRKDTKSAADDLPQTITCSSAATLSRKTSWAGSVDGIALI